MDQKKYSVQDLLTSYSELITHLINGSVHLYRGSVNISFKFAEFSEEVLNSKNFENLESINEELRFLLKQMFIIHEYMDKVMKIFSNETFFFVEQLRLFEMDGKIKLDEIICPTDFEKDAQKTFEERQQQLKDLFKQRGLEFNLPFENERNGKQYVR